MINFFLNKNTNKISPLINDLINFTKHDAPESLDIMHLLPELSSMEPTEADLDAMEKAFNERDKWAPDNRKYWEKIFVDFLSENGRILVP